MTEHRQIWFHADSQNVDFFLDAIKKSGGWQVDPEPGRQERDGTNFLVYEAHRESQ